MRYLIRSRFAIASLVILAVLVFAKVSIDQSVVEDITIVGDLSNAQLVDLKGRIAGHEQLYGSDVVQSRVEQLAWVREARVRRQWPAGLVIEVVPEQVMAYWNDDGFINSEGQVLVTDLLVGGDLPGLYGPAGTEVEVMTRYQQLGGMLATRGLEIKRLNRSARSAWTIETRNRMTIILGKEDLRARMDRFLEVHDAIARAGDEQQQKRIARMDARYVNGVAVHFEDETNLVSQVSQVDSLAEIGKETNEI